MPDRQEVRQAALNVSGGLLVIATVSMLAYLGWALVNKEVSINNKDALMLLLGALIAKYGDLVGFFFGSSAGSKKQAETIEKQASEKIVVKAEEQ